MKAQLQGEQMGNTGCDNGRFQILRTLADSSPRDREIAKLCLDGFNRAEIAKYVGLTRQRVWQILEGLDLKTKPRKVTVQCEFCGKSFTKFRTLIVRSKHRFCSRYCLSQGRQASSPKAPCHVCGTLVHRTPSRAKTLKRVFCSAKCYYSVRQQRPYVAWRQGQRIARQVVSVHFKLEPGYVVHHHDGNNRNNALSNLAVFRNNADHMAHHHGVTPVKPLWDGRQL